MDQPADSSFTDHPTPSAGLILLLLIALMCFAVAMLNLLQIPSNGLPSRIDHIILIVLIIFTLILCLTFWLIYSTYYTLDSEGLTVKYGPSIKTYLWSDFKAVYWRKGIFATKIGRPSVTPCVRLSNAVALHRKNKRLALYLTPNDPKEFIEKITLFAPELTHYMIR